MAKLTTADIATFSQAAITTINNNFAAVETAMEKTLSRDGTTPNQMTADLDMNGNDILNIAELDVDSLSINGNPVTTVSLTNFPSTPSRYVKTNASGQPTVNSLSETTALDLIAASAPSGRNYLDAPVYVTTRDLMKELDVTVDTVAFLTESGRKGEYRWDGSDLSSKILIQTYTPVGINDTTNKFSARTATATTTDDVTDTITAASHGFSNMERFAPTTTANTILYAGGDYYAWAVTGSTFQVATSSTSGGRNFTGTTNQTWLGFHELDTADCLIPVTSANGFVAGTKYYVIRTNWGEFQLASTPENAAAGIAIDFSGTTGMSFYQIADPQEMKYVIPTGKSITGSQGAWVRQSPFLDITHAGAVAGSESWYPIQAAIYLGSRLRIPVYWPGGTSAYTISYGLQRRTHSDLTNVSAYPTLRKPDNGLTILGDNRGFSRVKASSTFPASTALLNLDANMNAVPASPVYLSYAQGDNILKDIGLEGRGQSTGTDLKGLTFRGTWNFRIDGLEIINCSGPGMELVSAAPAASGFDDVDTSAHLNWRNIRIANCGDTGLKLRQARCSSLHMLGFEISDCLKNGIEGGPINSTFVNGAISGCGERATATTGGMRLYDALTSTGTSSLCRNIILENVQFENNFNHELNTVACIGLTVIGGTYNPYPQTGGAVADKAMIRLTGVTGATFIRGKHSAYSLTDGDFWAIDVASGCTGIVVDGMQFDYKGSNVRLTNGVRFEMRNVDTDLAITLSGTAIDSKYNEKPLGYNSTGYVSFGRSRVSADRAISNDATAQAWFASTGDAFSVENGKFYEIDAFLWVARTAGTDSHTFAVLFGGTATLTNIEYTALVSNGNGNVLEAPSWIIGTAGTATTLTAANTSATENVKVRIKGTFLCGGSGTLIPQLQYSVAPGGAPTVKRGTYCVIEESMPGAVALTGFVA